MNDDPVLYSKTCQMQKFYANQVLDKYLHLLHLKTEANILDVGAAEGTVTLETLRPKLPRNFNKLVLSDIAESMVNFAKRRIDDDRIDIVRMDIRDPIPSEFKQFFHHIFSFYCLNCIEEERWLHTIQNIFDMLKPGGSIFFVIVASAPFYNVYKNLSKNGKWQPFMANYKKVVSPFHWCKNPEDKLKSFLDLVGFEVLVSHQERHIQPYSNFTEFLDFAFSIIPFIRTIPESTRDDFIEDVVSELRRSDMLKIEVDDEGNERTHMTCKILIACASKPSLP